VAQTLAKGSRITGDRRSALATEYAQRYAAGESIRQIAEDSGRSFGFVHGVLSESGVQLRGRGGATRGAVGDSGSSPGAKAPSAPAKKSAGKSAAAKKAATGKAATTKTAG